LALDPSQITVRPYRPGDETAILDTFNRVFAQVDPTFRGRTLEEWRWLYRENPSGTRIMLAWAPDGRLVSQYAGLPARALVDGVRACFNQAVDSMTDPAFRRGLKKPGFFVLTARPFSRLFLGPPPEQDPLVWGFPVPSAWRIGRAYLKYGLVRTQLKLTVHPAALRPGAAPGVDVEEVRRVEPGIEAVTLRAAEACRAIALRDAPQLEWRFLRHPQHRYRIAVARRGGRPVGLAVHRKGSFDGREDLALICDWLVEPGDAGAENALLAWLAETARAEGAAPLCGIFSEALPPWRAFQRAGFVAEPTRYFLTGRSWRHPRDLRWYQEHWYYTLGDSDLV